MGKNDWKHSKLRQAARHLHVAGNILAYFEDQPSAQDEVKIRELVQLAREAIDAGTPPSNEMRFRPGI